MAAKQEPNLGLNYGWALGESGFKNQMDENLRTLGALVLLSVLSATTGTPPGSPTGGERYLLPSGATGAWSGEDGNIARYNDEETTWEFWTPAEGWEVVAQDTMQRWHYNGTAWALWASRLGQYADDSAAASSGVPVDGLYVNSSSGALTVRLT